MDADAIVGTYKSATQRFVLTDPGDGNIALRLSPKCALADVESADEIVLMRPNGSDRFVIELLGYVLELSIVRDDDKQYLYMSRLFEKVA